jgi:CxxC motif-containing protein
VTTPDRFTYLCTRCPLGCRLEVDVVDDDIVEIRGFECAKGKRYAKEEHTDPRRPLSTTVAVSGGHLPRLPVRTAEPVPKQAVLDVVRSLRQVTVQAPVTRNQVIVTDVAGTGIEIIATRAMATAATTP